MVNLGQRKGVPNGDHNGLSSTAEAGTLQLEFKYLSYLTDDDTYWKAVEKVVLSRCLVYEESDVSSGYGSHEKCAHRSWSGPHFYLVSMHCSSLCARSLSGSHVAVQATARPIRHLCDSTWLEGGFIL